MRPIYFQGGPRSAYSIRSESGYLALGWCAPAALRKLDMDHDGQLSPEVAGFSLGASEGGFDPNSKTCTTRIHADESGTAVLDPMVMARSLIEIMKSPRLGGTR